MRLGLLVPGSTGEITKVLMLIRNVTVTTSNACEKYNLVIRHGKSSLFTPHRSTETLLILPKGKSGICCEESAEISLKMMTLGALRAPG